VSVQARQHCTSCGTLRPADAAFCPKCGRAFAGPAAAPVVPPRAAGSSTHSLLKGLLGLWAIGYVVLSCSPMLAATNGSAGAAAGGLASFVVGGLLFGPWIIGIIVLSVLVLVTK
jgi:hypothetical protein